MIRRVVPLGLVAVLGLALLYLSRFWVWSLWPRDGLLGLEALPPQGGLLARWLRGTELAPFELLIWAMGCFLLLTGVQRAVDALKPKESPKKETQ